MSEQTTSPNPPPAAGTPQNNEAASNEELGGLFQENENKSAGATTETEAAATGAEGAAGEAGAGESGVATTEKATTSITRDDIVEILKEAGLGEREAPAPQPPPQPEMTAEQFEKAFNVFNPSEDLVKRLTDESPAVRIKALQEMRDGVIRQAMTMTEYRVQQHLATLRANDIEPLHNYVSTRQAADFHDEFFEKYADLEPYELIVDAVSSRLQEKGFTAKSREEVMKRYADDARAVVKELLAKGGTTAAPAKGNGATTTKPKRQMSTLTGGGQGGGSGAATTDKYAGLPPTVAAGLAVLD